MRDCTSCGETKELDAFGPDKTCAGGIKRRCRACDNEYSRAYYKRNVAKRMWLGARDRATKSGVPFSIREQDIVIPDVCPVLGLKLSTSSKRGGTDESPSLDRIVPQLGYTKSNVVVISGRANRIKSDCTALDILAVGVWLQKLTNGD